jgi:hypothetical protein
VKKLYLLFGLVCVVLVMYFHQGSNWNANSRMLMVYSLVENHSLQANPWLSTTGDFAQINGRVYGEKAPLASLVVLPFYWLARVGSHGPQTEAHRTLALHLADLVACAVPFAIFAALLLRRLFREGQPARAAVWLTLAAAFGTFLAHYGASFFGCMLAGTLLLGCYVLAAEKEERFGWAGFLGGCAVLTEYPLVLTQILLVGYLLTGTDRWRRTLRYLAGAVPPALLMLAHNQAITGSMFDFPYRHVPPRWAYMRDGYGMRWPSFEVAWQLLGSPFRGLGFYAPALLLLVPLLVLRFQGPRRRRNLLLALLAVLFLFNLCYRQWNGGSCIGPRFASALVVLALYEGIAALAARGAGFRWGFGALSFWGWLVTTLGSMTVPFPDENIPNPFFTYSWPRFWGNQLSDHIAPIELGILSDGKSALALWCILTAATGVGFTWAFRRRLARAAEGSPDREQVPAMGEPVPDAVDRQRNGSRRRKRGH